MSHTTQEQGVRRTAQSLYSSRALRPEERRRTEYVKELISGAVEPTVRHTAFLDQQSAKAALHITDETPLLSKDFDTLWQKMEDQYRAKREHHLEGVPLPLTVPGINKKFSFMATVTPGEPVGIELEIAAQHLARFGQALTGDKAKTAPLR